MTDVLTHTGLVVPHARLGLAAPGIIMLDGQTVGYVTIEDNVEVYATIRPRTFSKDDWYDYAAACRTEIGDPIDVSDLLTYLRAEWRTDRALRRAAEAGGTVIQAMQPHGSSYLPGPALLVESWEPRAVVMMRAERTRLPAGSWWRIHDGTKWTDLYTTEQNGEHR